MTTAGGSMKETSIIIAIDRDTFVNMKHASTRLVITRSTERAAPSAATCSTPPERLSPFRSAPPSVPARARARVSRLWTTTATTPSATTPRGARRSWRCCRDRRPVHCRRMSGRQRRAAHGMAAMSYQFNHEHYRPSTEGRRIACQRRRNQHRLAVYRQRQAERNTATKKHSDGGGYCRGCGTTIGEQHHPGCDI